MYFIGGLIAIGLFWLGVGASGVDSLSSEWWLICLGASAVGLAINIAIYHHRNP